jgi:cyclin-dependent kinase regulatory subunit CKS1
VVCTVGNTIKTFVGLKEVKVFVVKKRKKIEFSFISIGLKSTAGSMNRMKIEEMQRNIYYSDKYYDDEYEYRHVVLPKEMVKLVPKTHLMSEEEWRGIGVQQSKGWVHYMTHSPEPHILLFKRPITTPPTHNGK